MLTSFNISEAMPFVGMLVIILYWLVQWSFTLAAGWEEKDRMRGALPNSK
jgi:hypothetical protein